ATLTTVDSEQWPDNDDRYYGLVNALYFSRQFRYCVQNFPEAQERHDGHTKHLNGTNINTKDGSNGVGSHKPSPPMSMSGSSISDIDKDASRKHDDSENPASSSNITAKFKNGSGDNDKSHLTKSHSKKITGGFKLRKDKSLIGNKHSLHLHHKSNGVVTNGDDANRNGKNKLSGGGVAVHQTISLQNSNNNTSVASYSSGEQHGQGLTSPTTTTTPSTNGATNNQAGAVSEALKANMPSSAKYGIPESMFSVLKDLFQEITNRGPRSGTLTPLKFVAKLKASNELFRSNAHQDAHEFLNYLLNEISENVAEIQRKKNINFDHSNILRGGSNFIGNTWVQSLFEGLLTNETKCITCENVTSRDETFLDVSIDIHNNSSVTNCLAKFAEGEMLCHNNKFFCDNCGGLQEAERRMRLKRLPNILALHLKRFKYHEGLGRYIKLSYRVNFPTELRVPDTAEEADDVLYHLFGVVIHLGGGPFHGHYISIVRSKDKWVLFDDDCIEMIEESELYNYFGDLPSYGSGYVLFYERDGLDSVYPSSTTSRSDSNFDSATVSSSNN
ncbi:hypothetical protein H4219_005688, partial [Mycoemilia scoparia]